MKITERDRRLLLDIQEYGLLPTKRIASRHFDKVALSTVLRRLRRLEKARYVQRIEGLKNGAHAWALTPTVANLLDDKPAKFHYPRQILDHDLALMELRMRLEEANVALDWKAEHVIRTNMARSRSYKRIDSMVVPDGLMGVSTAHFYQHAVAIELELTAKSQARYQEIFDEYGSRKELWACWYVVKKETIGRQLMKAAFETERGPIILWSLLGDVLKDPLKARVFGDGRETTVENMFMPGPAQPQLNFGP